MTPTEITRILLWWPWCYVALRKVTHWNIEIGFGRRGGRGRVVAIVVGRPLEWLNRDGNRIAAAFFALSVIGSEPAETTDA